MQQMQDLLYLFCTGNDCIYVARVDLQEMYFAALVMVVQFVAREHVFT